MLDTGSDVSLCIGVASGGRYVLPLPVMYIVLYVKSSASDKQLLSAAWQPIATLKLFHG
jgi:hypothetical protein